MAAEHAIDAAAAVPGVLDWAWLVGLRRAIHMRPEGGFKEVGTRAAIRHALVTRAGIPVEVLDAHPPMGAPHHAYGYESSGCTTTGMIVDITGTGPAVSDSEKRTIMMRADMDGLQMTEENASLPYRSRLPGFAHMCGHDGHVAALVGAAVLLNSPAVRRCIPSNSAVRLLFQPAEETPGGAEPMIKDGALENVDEVYGWHNWPTAPVGTMMITDGTIMAHDADFKIVVKGRGGHGSAPDACIDPVPCGAAIVMALQTIVSRRLHSATNAVVSVTSASLSRSLCVVSQCTEIELSSLPACLLTWLWLCVITVFHAGEATNVIPDSAELGGTIRDLNPEIFSTICKAMEQIVASTAAAYGCESTVSIEGGFAETTNPPSGVALVRKLAVEEPKAMTLSEEGLPLMGTEDFGYYLKQRPGCFFLCGAMETQRCGLSALPFDGGEGYHPEPTEEAAPERPPAAKRQRSATSHMDIERCAPCDPVQSSTIPGAGWANSLRTNCCPHGTAFDFNDNVLPFVVVSGCIHTSLSY